MPMRKVIAFILIFAMVTMACAGCGTGKKPDDVSDRVYELGIAALETADEFLAGTISGEDAADRLYRTCILVEAEIDQYKEETGSDTLVGTDYWKDTVISSSISLLKLSIGSKSSGSGNSRDVLERRNDLAGYLNEKKK